MLLLLSRRTPEVKQSGPDNSIVPDGHQMAVQIQSHQLTEIIVPPIRSTSSWKVKHPQNEIE
ncbi:hypothetical protein BLOT_006817 [Blomia tropicalis]|nr:hypothetical protein BLOT_006817 [Blomia tropicalis]